MQPHIGREPIRLSASLPFTQPSGSTQSVFIVANLVWQQEIKADASHGCRKSSDDTVGEPKPACCVCTSNSSERWTSGSPQRVFSTHCAAQKQPSLPLCPRWPKNKTLWANLSHCPTDSDWSDFTSITRNYPLTFREKLVVWHSCRTQV